MRCRKVLCYCVRSGVPSNFLSVNKKNSTLSNRKSKRSRLLWLNTILEVVDRFQSSAGILIMWRQFRLLKMDNLSSFNNVIITTQFSQEHNGFWNFSPPIIAEFMWIFFEFGVIMANCSRTMCRNYFVSIEITVMRHYNLHGGFLGAIKIVKKNIYYTQTYRNFVSC